MPGHLPCHPPPPRHPLPAPRPAPPLQGRARQRMAAPRRVMPPPPLAAGGAKQRGRDPRGGAVAGHRRVPQVRRGRARASQGPRAGEHRSPPVSGPAGQASAVTARLPCRHRAAGLCVAYCLGPLPDLLDHDACPSIPPGRLRHAHVPLASRPAYALTRVTRVARLTRRLSAATCASASSSPTRPPPPGCPPPHRRRSVDGPETGKGQRASGTGGPVRDMDRIP